MAGIKTFDADAEALTEQSATAARPAVPAQPKYGIKETREGLIFMMTLISVGANYKSLSIRTAQELIFDVVPQGFEAIKGADNIPQEIDDIDPDELAILCEIVRERFNIDDDPKNDNLAERLVKRCIGGLSEIGQAIMEFRAAKTGGEQGAPSE